ncbi:tetraacyldisaccharide 4''-kinase [Mizugakiibacter sediminis]|uniref:Tetraacyldisaccharide 4'-kinase n=1 Tax=Mizugakiibacter sediminis TaxID=1475481 RepID=A0A0K8QRL8_9GAMM|nr:tetraacyldisaccharide 4'-kinase [Mizugakiibacter sediminis]GAP67301.1 tetraacyldisaccharide 4''-kinase [Mizugakiibacter sediminis]
MAWLDRLQQRWYADLPPPPWTRPVAALYGGATALRRALYRRGWLSAQRLPLPVVVVGNLTAGGTGKTPLTIALAQGLRARGFSPGVVSRGYGGSRRGNRLLDDGSDPREEGDEPCLIRARTGVPVAVGRDRPAAARLLLTQGVDAVIADDGLQHYRLARDVEICVIDGDRRFGNGRLLPAGPLREPPARLATVDFRVCNGGSAAPGEVAMTLEARYVEPLVGAERPRPLAAFAGQRVHAVAGIGNPGRFFAGLRAAGIEVIAHPFPDHHAFAPADLAFGDALPVLMTEKDAVKCRPFAAPRWWSLPVDAKLAPGFLDAVAERLREASRRRR